MIGGATDKEIQRYQTAINLRKALDLYKEVNEEEIEDPEATFYTLNEKRKELDQKMEPKKKKTRRSKKVKG